MNTMNRRHFAALVTAVVAAALALGGCATDSRASRAPASSSAEDRYGATVRVGTLPPLRVEVADTSAERTQGLSGRQRLPPGTGMIFLYDSPTTTGFWMYDVHFPLSLAWVRDGRVIGTVEMAPCTATDPDECRSYQPPGPFDTVIEAPAGTFAGVEPGTPVRVTFHRGAGG